MRWDTTSMTNQPPPNPDALEVAAKALYDHFKNQAANDGDSWPELEERDEVGHGIARDDAEVAVSAYLAVAQPEVNSFDPRELNRRGWTCGCEPGNYDSCDECQSACNELAGFLNRPEVKP